MNLLALLHRGGTAAASRIRNLYYRALGVQIDGKIWMRHVEIPRCWSQIRLDHCALDRGVTLLATGEAGLDPKISIGPGTYVNRFTMFDAHRSIRVGTRCMLGPHCYITDADHGTEVGIQVTEQLMEALPVIIDDGAWLGAHVTVLKGVTIGKGAVVGAGSVVTRSIKPNAIAVGVPARVIGSRTTDAEES